MHKKDLTGQKFGKLTVLYYCSTNKNGKPIWKCKCDCGNTKDVLSDSLLSGNTISCGCISKEQISKERKKNLTNNTNVSVIRSLINNNKSTQTKSGIKGVGWAEKRKRWRAYIMFQGKYYHLGYFRDKDKAILARKKAEEKLFGEFLEWYEKEYKKK